MAGQQEPTWKVYLAEWLTVYTSDRVGQEAGEAECREYFTGKYAGRVRDADWRFTVFLPDAESLVSDRPVCLQLRLPNLHGEFKDYSDAVQAASELLDDRGGTAHVVQRGSAEERALLDYGKKKFPDAG
jgi:hypothetical protein